MKQSKQEYHQRTTVFNKAEQNQTPLECCISTPKLWVL